MNPSQFQTSDNCKLQELYKTLLQRNSFNYSVIKKYTKRIQQKQKYIQSIQQLKKHPNHNHQYGVHLPSIFKNKQKPFIITNQHSSFSIEEKQVSMFRSTININQNNFTRNSSQSLFSKIQTNNVIKNINGINNTQNDIRQSQLNSKIQHIQKLGNIVNNSESAALNYLRISKRNFKYSKQPFKQLQHQAQKRQMSNNNILNYTTNNNLKTPLNLKNIVFHNQTQKTIINAPVQPKGKKTKKSQYKNFILSSSSNDSLINNHNKGNKNNTNSMSRISKQNQIQCMNILKKQVALMKSINNSLDKIMYASIFKSSTDVKQVMMKVNAIPIVK